MNQIYKNNYSVIVDRTTASPSHAFKPRPAYSSSVDIGEEFVAKVRSRSSWRGGAPKFEELAVAQDST